MASDFANRVSSDASAEGALPAEDALPAEGSSLRRSMRRVVWFLLLAMMFSTTGCGGCRSETPQERASRMAAEEKKAKEEAAKKKKKKEKKPPFEIAAPIAKPSETGAKISRAKRGHWMTETQLMKANYQDWGGETTLRVLDSNGQPVPIERTPFQLLSSRPVQLAKGRPRQIENVFLVPQVTGRISVESRLRERNHGAERSRHLTPLSTMESYQYFFVVLAKEPNQYAYLKSLNAVLVPQDDAEGNSEDLLHYQVLLPNVSKQVPLPDNPLCWTTVAYILWDEVDPTQLDRKRREALVDWLHWGGQLIINGPDSLKLLENSFLSPYLPATDSGPVLITQDDVESMNQFWTKRTSKGKRKKLTIVKPWSGIQLQLAEGVEPDRGLAASTGGLLVERRVGRGRIVVSRMQLAERDLLTWSPHYDDLFNAGIMRRKPRHWSTGPFGEGADSLHGEWAGALDHQRDSAFVTHHRLFSRDVHADPNATNWKRPVQEEPANVDPLGNFPNNYNYSEMDEESLKQTPEVVGGIGAWNNFNATSNAAREALREAAGVRVPPASFVVTCLSVYLLVLVPFNWFFFKALGRVEYAWIAAPVIALLGTAVVVKQAQLDIGFVRAQTEIGLLEIQGDHSRAHLSRYTALYTSLSTTYDLEFDDPTALAAPFPTRDNFRLIPGQSRSNVELTQTKKVRLSGLRVSSASTDMLHSEQMLAMDGPLVYRQIGTNQWRLTNQSRWKLRSVAVVKRADQGKNRRMLGCWIGELRPNQSTTVVFELMEDFSFAEKRPFAEKRSNATAKLPKKEAAQLNLEPLFHLALDPAHIDNGEVRLVGRVDRVLPGVTVAPAAPQIRGATLVVAHLDRAKLPLPTPDPNSPRDAVLTENQLPHEDFGS